MSKRNDATFRNMFVPELATVWDMPERLARALRRAPDVFKHYGFDDQEIDAKELPATGALWLSGCTRASAIASLKLLLKCVEEAEELSDEKKEEDIALISWHREGPTEAPLTASVYVDGLPYLEGPPFVFHAESDVGVNIKGDAVKRFAVEIAEPIGFSSDSCVLLGVPSGTGEDAVILALDILRAAILNKRPFKKPKDDDYTMLVGYDSEVDNLAMLSMYEGEVDLFD